MRAHQQNSHASPTIPARAGVGLKSKHYRSIIGERPAIGFFEVHAENYMGEGGPPHRYLVEIRNHYPLSCSTVWDCRSAPLVRSTAITWSG